MNIELLNSRLEFENDRARLVPFDSSRIHELQNVAFDADIWKYMGMSIRNESDFDAYRTQTLAAMRQGSCIPFLIIDRQTDRVAGSTRYGNLSIPSEKCEIGWTWLGADFRGTGLNKACKAELLRVGFEEIGFRRIQFSVDEDNVRSQRAVERLGAQKEGLFRNNYIAPTGESRNDVYYSIIREDWPLIKQERFRDVDHPCTFPEDD